MAVIERWAGVAGSRILIRHNHESSFQRPATRDDQHRSGGGAFRGATRYVNRKRGHAMQTR